MQCVDVYSNISLPYRVRGEEKCYDWVLKSTPREPNRPLTSFLQHSVHTIQFTEHPDIRQPLCRQFMSQSTQADEREVAFFSDLRPRLEKVVFWSLFILIIDQFLVSKGLEGLLPVTANIPYAVWNDQDKVLCNFVTFSNLWVLKVLVMENLKAQGWRDAIKKKEGLDVDHLRMAFKVLILVLLYSVHCKIRPRGYNFN